ncbi:NrfD/PsrC family molybdoenzyme membrane anchor subunit [Anaeromyxobacter paludicola]|uniref:NrfD n=1 Tax=Anaeromyxobacter paludicola TaxID=2918171 RepID=A0ABM7XBE3_9BACT|nr:NrfD/PsrC family molybdoenzyme membrane anchor subunit [Anaeromyxobacter paludicola]BDG09141.1 NrfD [Anaeromyxobacter paludicola]
MNELDVARYSHLIDPKLHVWGWEIPVYLFLGGVAAGAMVLSSWLALGGAKPSKVARRLAFAPAVLVGLGMGALFLDLAYKLHAWRFYLAFRWTSPMSWGAWILVVMMPVSLLVALGGLDEAELPWPALAPARALALRHRPALLRANLVVGAGLGLYTGVLLSTLGARALWSSALLGPLFLVSGLSTGAAFLLLFGLSEEERHRLHRFDQLAIVVEGLVLFLFLAGLATSGAAGKEAAAMLLGGAWAAPFWVLVVFGGLALPLLLEALETGYRLRPTALAPVLVLAGGFLLRVIFVAAGQA